MPRGTAAAGVLLVSLAGTVAHAQSLADAASKAEEQRKASGQASKVYTDETLLRRDGFESLVADRYLLREHFTPYMYARVSIVNERMSNHKLDDWLLPQEEAGNRYKLEAAYRSDPILTAILTKWNISARDYFMADASFEMATEDLKRSWKQEIVLSPARKENVDFVKERDYGMPYYIHTPWDDAEQNLRSGRRMRKR